MMSVFVSPAQKFLVPTEPTGFTLYTDRDTSEICLCEISDICRSEKTNQHMHLQIGLWFCLSFLLDAEERHRQQVKMQSPE